ncbi:MAG TPA: hypothetical protein PK728_08785 [Bacillota bacterium]|nr:hypothetical protein [Bacillota bacterium]
MFQLDLALIKAMVFLLALIIVNVILGVTIAVRDNNFKVDDLPRFLQTEILPYYLSLLSLAGLAMVQDVQTYGTKPLAWAAIVAYGTKTVFVEIRKKVFKLFGVETG